MASTPDTLRATDLSGVELAAHDIVQTQLVLLLERARPLVGGARYSLACIDQVTIGRGSTRVARRVMHDGRPTLEITIPDERISVRHARIERAGPVWRFIDCDSTNGSRLNRARIKESALSDADILELGRTLFRFRAHMRTPANASADVDGESLRGLQKAFGTILPWLERDLETLARVARSELPVLLLGETGTGKELLARGIHECSGRAGPFVAVNCGGLPVTLMESLFFGHKKGSFSGAVQDEIGLVRASQGGTLFLDEVGDLPAPCQAALLRVLQEREVIPVGSTRAVRVDIRVVAATHRPLANLAKSGAFREDLLARLSAFTWAVPPLRERLDDIGVIVATILARTATDREKSLSFSSAAAYSLFEHGWPHNVRELEQRLKLGALLGSEGRIELSATSPGEGACASIEAPERRVSLTVEDVELALRQAPTVSAAAKILGIHRSHMYRLIRQFGITPRVKSAGERDG